jgi:hypothetical protein
MIRNAVPAEDPKGVPPQSIVPENFQVIDQWLKVGFRPAGAFLITGVHHPYGTPGVGLLIGQYNCSDLFVELRLLEHQVFHKVSVRPGSFFCEERFQLHGWVNIRPKDRVN